MNLFWVILIFIDLAFAIELGKIGKFRKFGKFKNNIPGVITNCHRPGMIALTFDDGVVFETAQLLNILKEQHVPATFFIIASTIEHDLYRRSILKRILEEGHTLGSHTYSHIELPYLSADGIESELNYAGKIFKNASGKIPKFIRPPYGSVNNQVVEVTDKIGYKIVNWNLETNDWRPGCDQSVVIEALKSGELDGSHSSKIVLLHDRPVTVTILESVIKFYRKLDYNFVNMETCLGIKGYF